MSRSRLFLNGRSPSFTNYKQIITHVKQISRIIIHFGKKISKPMQFTIRLFLLVEFDSYLASFHVMDSL